MTTLTSRRFAWEVVFCTLAGCVIPISQESGQGQADAGPAGSGATGSSGSAAAGDSGSAPTADGGGQGASGASAGSQVSCVDAGTCGGGTWVNVTPSSMPAAVLIPQANAYGPGTVIVDPSRPSDLYIGPAAGIWKSTDYGQTWTQINSDFRPAPMGVTLAIGHTTPPTIYASDEGGYIFRSTDGGVTFTHTGQMQRAQLYSLAVDPNDPKHLVSGMHEVDGILESTDSGDTWRTVGGANFPTGAISWFPYFMNTGDPTTTSSTWIAIPQNGGSICITKDRGATWTIPNGVDQVQHPVGTTQLYQNGSTFFVTGNGIHRSTDFGANWTTVERDKAENIVWGTPRSMYAMWSWACSPCSGGTNFMAAAQPGDNWSPVNLAMDIPIGPQSVAVTYDGSHYIFVGVFWGYGVWRYVEP